MRALAPVLVLPLTLLAACSGQPEVHPEADDIAVAEEMLAEYEGWVEPARAEREEALEQAERVGAAATSCETENSGLVAALQEIDSRLGIGMNLGTYGGYVGDAQVAYDVINFDALVADDPEGQLICVTTVSAKLEEALNEYAEVYGIWSDCITDYPCDSSEGETNEQMQAGWLAASAALGEATSALETMLGASTPEVLPQVRAVCDGPLADMPEEVADPDGLQAEWLEFAQVLHEESRVEPARHFVSPLVVSVLEVALAKDASAAAAAVVAAEDERDAVSSVCDG